MTELPFYSAFVATMKTSYTLTFSVSFITLIKHLFEYYESIVAPGVGRRYFL